MRSSEDSRAALVSSFEAVSASGFEECYPVSQEEERFLGFTMAGPISAAQPKRLYHGSRPWYSLAARAWWNLGDADRAEALFLKALELAPQDSTIPASYTEFLCNL